MSDLTSKDGAFDIGYPLEEAIADANGWLRGTTMYEGMRGWKATLLVIMADRDRLTAELALARRPATEREPPHCSSCDCGTPPEATGTLDADELDRLTAEVAELRMSANANLYAAQQHMLKESVLASEVAELRRDAERLDWLEVNHTLHKAMEILYVVDGYEVTPTYNGNHNDGPFHGETLREAIDAARAALGEQP